LLQSTMALVNLSGMVFQKHSIDEARKKISSLAPQMTHGPLALTLGPFVF